MLRYDNQGLSLMEIMVVISIISILMVISVPIYKSYATKSKFAEIYTYIAEYRGEMQSAYTATDQFPSSFANLNASTYTNVSTATVQQIYYGIASNQGAGYIWFYTQDLGIPGFVLANGSGSGGNAGRITLAGVITNTGEMRFYCGQWDGSAADVPLVYLPLSCQDTNISALIS